MPLLGLDVPVVTETGHESPDNNRVGVHYFRHMLGRQGSLVLRHVKHDVEYARESAVAPHVTNDVT